MPSARRRPAFLPELVTAVCCGLPSVAASPRAQPPAPLVIDVHAHLFNGEDVPVQGFLDKVLLHEEHGDERRMLRPLTAAVHHWIVFFADSHERELRALDAELAEREHTGPPPVPPLTLSPAEALRRAGVLTEEVEDVSATAVEQATVAIDPGGFWRGVQRRWGRVLDVAKPYSYVRRFTAARYDNAKTLLDWHGDHGVDVFVAAMVDLDFWLEGRAVSRLEEQIEIMAKIALLTEGRVLPFVAFDPFRDAVSGDRRALRLAQLAVEKYGCVGVKLYPSMGFRPIGNDGAMYEAVVGDSMWRQLGYEDAEFAAAIESAMHGLLAWCEREQVPVMAHCNTSNASHPVFVDAAHPRHWARVLARYPELRLNLAHFGGASSLLQDDDDWAEHIIALMAEHDGVFADFGNFKLRAADDIAPYFTVLRTVLEQEPEVGQRLMYGSDWFMHAARSYSKHYPDRFRTAVRKNLPELEAAIMGGNAARFLGLRPGDRAYARLRAFYDHHAIRPHWR